MKSKKAQGMPINVIIIAVIALILLVVILAITSGKLKVFGKGTANCKAQGGDCEPVTFCVKPKYTDVLGTDCESRTDGKTLCCIALY
ncbi:TPA: hypothetical protein HA246_01315 [Candidatus Woesearchaeota archaeon]|nr:hypothetical protein [Candidatus Woesearchaeota archaeon]